MRKVNYDKYPSTKISGMILRGWNDVSKKLKDCLNHTGVLAVDLYTGVHEDEMLEVLHNLFPALIIDMRNLMKPEAEIKAMTKRLMTDDVLFGYVTNLSLIDYFDSEKLEAARRQIAQADQAIVMGAGASLIVPSDATLVYVDMARWEIQQRFRAHEVKALGIDNSQDAVSLQYKRGYFNDWRILDRYKNELFDREIGRAHV